MKRRRHSPEQIVRKLREADRVLGEGQGIPEVTKALQVSEAYHRWRNQYGGINAEDVKRLKGLSARTPAEVDRRRQRLGDRRTEGDCQGNW